MTSHIDYRMHHIQQEFNIFADYASKIAGPKIVCGDFNVTCEHPYLLPMWDKQFKDSLYGRHAPTFFSDRRIDYILTSPEVNSVFDSKVIGDPQKLYSAEEPSDHLPLLTTIYLRADSNPLKKARIIVKCDAGFGNKLFIRGNGPGMSWERGTELRNIDKETWIFETQNDLSSFEYKVCKVLFNHAEIWETGHNHKTEWNKKQEIFPKFLT